MFLCVLHTIVLQQSWSCFGRIFWSGCNLMQTSWSPESSKSCVFQIVLSIEGKFHKEWPKLTALLNIHLWVYTNVHAGNLYATISVSNPKEAPTPLHMWDSTVGVCSAFVWHQLKSPLWRSCIYVPLCELSLGLSVGYSLSLNTLVSKALLVMQVHLNNWYSSKYFGL